MKKRIPTLQAVLDPHELGKHLYRALPAQWGSVRQIQIRVLQHHRTSRCVVDIRLQTTTGIYEVVGKVYAEDRSDVYRAMKQISQSGFGFEEEFSIPQPLAFIPELHLLLQEKIQGPLVTDIFLKGSERERAVAAERCACWLAHFHARAAISGPVFSIGHELLENWVRRLARRAGPQAEELTDRAALLCERLENAAVKLDRDRMCACHGTYCHHQIILTETRMVTVDWDGFCVAHPGLDLARFSIVLQQLALQSHGSLHALDAAVEIFYKTYTALSSFNVAEHLPFYKAAHCLKHAKDHLRSGKGGVEMAKTMLDEGLFILGEKSEIHACTRRSNLMSELSQSFADSGISALQPVLELMERCQHGFVRRKSPLANKAQLLFQRLKIAASALDCTEMCACHGDYSHHQVILTETRTVTLDWDSYCAADPTRDVAKFILKLQQLALKLHGSRKALDAAIELFCETYTATSKFEVMKHLPFYKAVQCLQHAKTLLKRDSNGFEKTEALLDEGLRILAEGMTNGKRFIPAYKPTIRPHKLHDSYSPGSESAHSFADPRIRALRAVLDPCDLGRYLYPILPPHWGILRDIQINVLKNDHGKRRIVDIALQTTTGKHELIGKVYGRDRSDVYRAMKQISQSGFGPEEEFSIPQAFAFIPELNLLLQEKVPGPLVTEIFLMGDERERARAAEQCARWLAHFQTHAPMSGPAFVLRPMERWASRLRKSVGSLHKAQLLFQRLEMAALALDGTERCACHGGYTHHQITSTKTRTAVFDWDNYCVAEPGWDVARFIMGLQMLALESLDSLKALDRATEVFYQTYATLSRFELTRQFSFHKAAYCLKRAGHFLKLRSNEKTEAMLDEGLRILAEEM